MAYSEYVFTHAAASGSSTAGKATKELVADLVSQVPTLSIISEGKDTDAWYDANLSIAECSNLKLRIHNNNSTTFHFVCGANLSGTSEIAYYDKTLSLTSNVTIRLLISDGMYFFKSLASFGRLTSIVDGSKIQVYGPGDITRVAIGGTSYASITTAVPSISTAQANTLPANTAFLAEGVMSTDSNAAIKAPYGLNGRGPYSFASASSFAVGSVISNGTDYFYRYATGLAIRV